MTAEQLASPTDRQPAQPKDSGLVPLSAKQGWYSPRCGIERELWSPHLSLLGSIAVVIQTLGAVFPPTQGQCSGVLKGGILSVVERGTEASTLVRDLNSCSTPALGPWKGPCFGRFLQNQGPWDT